MIDPPAPRTSSSAWAQITKTLSIDLKVFTIKDVLLFMVGWKLIFICTEYSIHEEETDTVVTIVVMMYVVKTCDAPEPFKPP
jgi:hypothetical protein